MEIRYMDEKQIKPVRRTYLGTEDYLVGYKKLLQEKAQQEKAKRHEMMRRQKTSKIAQLRKISKQTETLQTDKSDRRGSIIS